MTRQWFEVDRNGLAQVLGRQSKGRAIAELIANAWDEPGVTSVTVRISSIVGRPRVQIEVEDDAPNGFQDLRESYVLFAASKKKGEPATRGRFNVGEKLFIARCIWAAIESTTGTVKFHQDGHRVNGTAKRERGTLLTALMDMTRDELTEVEALLHQLIPPASIKTQVRVQFGTSMGLNFTLNDVQVPPSQVLRATLPTELSDAQGSLRQLERETDVEVYRLATPMLYELGIPVVAIDGPFSINVMQKVPLTLDRENVRPAFLRKLRVAVLDATHALLKPDEAKAEWVTEALAGAASDTVSNVLDQRFGAKRVTYDPSDPEASKRAASEGYTVVPGGALPAATWERVRETGAMKSAGQVTPTKHPRFSPDGIDTEVPFDKWTDAQKVVGVSFKLIGQALLRDRTGLSIRIVRDRVNRHAAWYGRGGFLTLNLQVLGHRWFEDGASGLQEEHVDLLLHELGHEWSGDHLASEYHEALTRLGARLALLLVQEPGLRRALRRETVAAKEETT